MSRAHIPLSAVRPRSMENMNPTLSWERVGQRFFRSIEGPPLQWGLQISHKHLRGALFGGVIGVWDREDIIVRQPANAEPQRHRPRMNLYNAQGAAMGNISLDFGSVVDVLIPIDETIIIVSGTGLCRHYTDFGQNFVQVHLPGTPVRAVKCTGGYVVQLDMEEGLSLVFVTKYATSEPKMRAVSLETPQSFETWSVLPANEIYGRSETIIAVTTGGEVQVYDLELTPTSRRSVANNVPVGRMAISPDGSNICLSDGTEIVVYTSDFHNKVFSSRCSEHQEIYWVGNRALALITGAAEFEIVSIEGLCESTTVYFDDDEVAIICEPDGLRVLGSQSHTLFAPVLKSTADTFKLGSTAPSAILLSCVDYLDVGSPRADQNVKLLGPQVLVRAVDTCITAALAEVDTKLQKRLMRAAAFGKSVLDLYDSTRYLDALTELRVGNTLRNLPEMSFFVTSTQLVNLGYAALIRRLELRQLWPIAAAIARLKSMPVEPVYIEWACWYIQTETSKDDDELLHDLEQRLSKLEAYSRSKMARRAIEQGRRKLALALLEREPVLTDRVLVMMEMEMVQQALEQAVRSGYPYLVDYVLLILAEQLTLSQLMSNVGWNTPLVERYIHLLQLPPTPKESLHQFLIQVDKRPESLNFEFEDIVQMADSGRQIQGLSALEKKFSNTGKKFYQESRVCAEWADLLEKQRSLESAFNETKFTGLSAAETITALLKISQDKMAEQIRAKLGVSERQFWWLRLNVLCERRDWHGLWDLSQKQRPPIGFRPFFDAVFEAGNLEAAAKYAELISDASIEEKVTLLLKCKQTDKARELAIKSRDTRAVALVQD